MQWFFFFFSGLLEIVWAVGLKLYGFSQILPGIIIVFCMVLSFYFLMLALKSLPLGTAYAIWTGIGTLGSVIFGIILFKEPVTYMRLICISFILFGIIGLKLLTN